MRFSCEIFLFYFNIISRYEKNIKKLSLQFRDQPQKPLERAIWWMEWVLRNTNATDVLKSPILDYNIFQKQMIDIIVFLSILLLIILFALYKMCCCCLCRRKEEEKVISLSKKDN